MIFMAFEQIRGTAKNDALTASDGAARFVLGRGTDSMLAFDLNTDQLLIPPSWSFKAGKRDNDVEIVLTKKGRRLGVTSLKDVNWNAFHKQDNVVVQAWKGTEGPDNFPKDDADFNDTHSYQIDGLQGDDTLKGGKEDDTILGSDGEDLLDGFDGSVNPLK